MEGESRSIYRRNVVASYVQLGVTAINGFAAPAIAVGLWGKDVYGIWLIFTNLLGYLYTAGGMGLDNAVFVLMGRTRDILAKRVIFRKASLLLLGIALVAGMAFALLTLLAVPWIGWIGDFRGETAAIAQRVGNTMLLLFILNLPLTLAAGGLSGVYRQHLRSVFDAIGSLSTLAALSLSFFMRLELQVFALVFGGCQIAVSAVRWIVLENSLKPNSLPPPAEAPPAETDAAARTDLRAILGMSLGSAGFTMATMGGAALETFVLSHTWDLALVAAFILVMRLLTMALSLVMYLNNSLASVISHSIAHGIRDQASILRRQEGRALLLASAISTGFVLLVLPFTRLWLGERVDLDRGTILLAGIWGVALVRASLMQVFYNAVGQVQPVAIAAVAELGLRAALLLSLRIPAGIASVPASALAASVLVPNILLPELLARRCGHVVQWNPVRFVTASTALSAPLAAHLLIASQAPAGRLGGGLALAILAAIATYLWKTHER